VNIIQKWVSGAPSGPDELPELQEVRKWSRSGVLLAVSSLFVILAWGVLAPLDSAVVAHGGLKVDSYRQVIQHQEGGIVKAILVRNGDEVSKGQPLLVIEDLRVSASLDMLEQQYFSELAKNARLTAERDISSGVVWPETFLAGLAKPQVAEMQRKEKDLFTQRRFALNQQIDILSRQVKEAQEEMAATERQVVADRIGLKTMRDEAQANRGLLEKGFISPTRMLALDRSEADYASRQAEHEADLARARQKQSDLKFRIEGLKNAYRESAATELKESNDRLNDMRQKVKPAQDAQERQQVVSPVDGTIVDLKVHTVGASIGPREVLMEVVPRGQELVAELKLPIDSVSDIHVGMPAEVRLSAFQQRTTPLIPGKLIYVSADALQEPGVQGGFYYLARVSVDADALKAANLGSLQAGMPVEAYLRVRSRSAIAYFFDPVTQSMSRAFRER
jgi:HlyD family type I secretion membrane fusion protein